MNLGAVLVCAGRGERLKAGIDKAFVLLDTIPVFFYAFRTLARLSISQIAVVSREKNFSLIEEYTGRTDFKGRVLLVKGGPRRQDSVFNGISSLDKNVEYVIVHDGARPFIDEDKINRLIRCIGEGYSAATLGIPEREAIKNVKDSMVEKTLERKGVYRIQTPQIFRKETLLRAYDKFSGKDVYDETELLEKAGEKVKVVMGDIFNVKITYPEDMALAGVILKLRKDVNART